MTPYTMTTTATQMERTPIPTNCPPVLLLRRRPGDAIAVADLYAQVGVPDEVNPTNRPMMPATWIISDATLHGFGMRTSAARGATEVRSSASIEILTLR